MDIKIEYGVTRFRGDRMELFFQNDLTKMGYLKTV
ncbi:hypothetical protein CRC_01996 [Cylindrospermopsis raciborskii CS-505]|nr:hypothetical protein CRC_01996 [Cylindrospermopsis raciborskii CS-505]